MNPSQVRQRGYLFGSHGPASPPAAPWVPTDEALGQYVVEPNYSDAGTPTWTATIGNDVVALGAPTAVETVDGAAEYDGSSDWGSGCAAGGLSTWAGVTEHTLFAVVDLTEIASDQPDPIDNQCIITTDGRWIGLYLQMDTANTRYLLHFAEYNAGATQFKAQLDITALVGGWGVGSGYLIVQAKKDAGQLYVRACGASGHGTWVAGDAMASDTGGPASLFSIGGVTWTLTGIVKAAGSATEAWDDTTAGKFETWAQANHP